ncbi:hypothetical protein ABTM18_20405, partial [Acinetobacter baumannii]
RKVVAGDRLRVGPVELVVRDMTAGKVAHFGVELDPDEPWRVRLRRLPAARLARRVLGFVRPRALKRRTADD